MKTQLVLAAAFLALTFSGCFGYPEGTVRPGDTVTILFEATDASTGESAGQGSITFVVGSGTSGLGVEVERRLVGHRANDTVSVHSRDDPSRGFGEQAQVDRALPAYPAESTLNRTEFEANVGEPTVGRQFPLGGLYTAEVLSADAHNVTYRFVLEGDQRDEFPTVGVILLSRIEGGELTRTLEPMVGATFTIQPPSPFSPSPLGLAAGTYRTIGADASHILFAYNPSLDAGLLVEDLQVEMVIQSIQPAPRTPQPVDGNYGVRGGNQVLGDPGELEPSAQG